MEGGMGGFGVRKSGPCGCCMRSGDPAFWRGVRITIQTSDYFTILIKY
jgi:hypothetical protein